MSARRVGVAALLLALVTSPGTRAAAQTTAVTEPPVLLITIDGAGFADVFDQDPQAFALASLGGTALVSQRLSLATTTNDLFGSAERPYVEIDAGSVPTGPDGSVDVTKLRSVFERAIAGAAAPSEHETVIFVSRAPSAADIRAGDELGVIIMASGTGAQIDAALHATTTSTTAPALTSDSTRRDGVVTTSDIAVTLANLTGTPVPPGTTGTIIRPTDAPAPFALYQRYRDQRRLTVPIGVATGIYGAMAGLFALTVATRRRRMSPQVRTAAAWAAISIVPLGLALLEVGRLPRLTYAGVIPFLVGITVVLTTATVVIARRKGSVPAVVALAALVFLVLGVEAVMDWPGAVTPLLGGSQLDGGRFFGSPNAFIGLVLGAAVFVALGLKNVVAGGVVLFVTGLVIGSPWFGSDLGGAMTMCAVAGLWWSVRSHASVVRGMIVTAAGAIAGAALVVVAQRYLTSSPTHITQFAEGSGHAGGIVGTIAERFRIGVKLLATHPFAVLPVLGVPVALLAVLRPGERLAPTLREQPAFAAAIITILLGSVIAYATNDTGASALGLGFGSAVAVLLFVSLTHRDESVGAR